MKNGICRYDGKTFTEYTAKDGLGGTEFWGILIEQSGIIWITARGATTRFDPSVPLPNPKAFTVFTPADGLNCCVQSMYQDKSGNVWWGTGQGSYRFDGKRFYQVKSRTNEKTIYPYLIPLFFCLLAGKNGLIPQRKYDFLERKLRRRE
ncbi:hypothetical protein [Runella slithyformis]|uniref:hypothetical protein n=1 Tax=Runella slithyformis TaxID=106 RepID=UPI00059DD62C|nr:hypothetical protein [Runella slithyformis]